MNQTLTKFRRLFDNMIFSFLSNRYLLYNSCWEDPQVDKIALKISKKDRLLCIASAGCNVLDYALEGPETISAVDFNPRQIALLQLKISGIRNLSYEDFFNLFGRGKHEEVEFLYKNYLREDLDVVSKKYWDSHWKVFLKNGLYFHGLSGKFARGFHMYLGLRPNLRSGIERLLASNSLEEQKIAYPEEVAPLLWRKHVNWILSRQFVLNFLGVPKAQSDELLGYKKGGDIGLFVKEAVDFVFENIPISQNYFWKVYLTGSYTEACCPNYLKRDSFLALKNGLVNCIHPYIGSLTEFLSGSRTEFSKFILLDHMDWMSRYDYEHLQLEWNWILKRSLPNARVIFRSADSWPNYMDNLKVHDGGTNLMELLKFSPELSNTLNSMDRVHTYGGFHIADIVGASTC